MSHWEVAPVTMSGERLRFVAAEVVIGLLLSEDRPEDRCVFEDGIVAAARELVNTKPGLRERI